MILLQQYTITHTAASHGFILTSNAATLSNHQDVTILTSGNCMVAWILMVVFAVMFFVSVMGNILVLWVYKKRQAGNNCNVLSSKYEMESNYCYEATAMKQTRDTCL